MREKINKAVLRSLMNFEMNLEKGQLNFGLASHTVEINGERPRRWGLGRGWDSMVKHTTINNALQQQCLLTGNDDKPSRQQ